MGSGVALANLDSMLIPLEVRFAQLAYRVSACRDRPGFFEELAVPLPSGMPVLPADLGGGNMALTVDIRGPTAPSMPPPRMSGAGHRSRTVGFGDGGAKFVGENKFTRIIPLPIAKKLKELFSNF